MGVPIIYTDWHGPGQVKISFRAAFFPNAATCLFAIYYNTLAKWVIFWFPTEHTCNFTKPQLFLS